MATKKQVQDKIASLESERASIIDRTQGHFGFQIATRDWSKLSLKALQVYHDELKQAIEATNQALQEEQVKIYQEIEETKETTNEDLKEIVDNVIEVERVTDEEPETLTYMPEGQLMIDKRNPETRLIQCAIDNDLFSGTLWSQTGAVINAERSKFDIKDKKVMSQEFAALLDSRVESSMIPETGPDRKGEIITLRKKSGAVKWSSWQITARLVQNCSDIFKGIELLGYSTIFPGGNIIPRSQLDKLLGELESDKEKEAPYKTVQRCLESATKKLVEIQSIEEIVSCDEFMQTFMETFREQLEVLRSEIKTKEKAGAGKVALEA